MKIIKEDTVENIEKNNITYLTIISEQLEEIKNELKLKVIYEDNKTIRFINNLETNELLQKLSKYSINKLLIEELSIEDLFIEYYK